MDFLIGIGSGLAAGLLTLFILKVATLRIRKELKMAAEIEFEEICDLDGLCELREDEAFEREQLKATVSGERLNSINRSIWKISIIMSIVVMVIIIMSRFMKGM